MKLSNHMYDSLKFISTIFIPALATLIGTVGVALGYPEVTGVMVTIVSAIGVFIGSLIGLSSVSYNQDKENNNA